MTPRHTAGEASHSNLNIRAWTVEPSMTACDLSCREQPRAHAVLVTGAGVCQLLWCLFGVRAKNAEQFTFYGSASSGEAGAGTGGVALDSEYCTISNTASFKGETPNWA